MPRNSESTTALVPYPYTPWVRMRRFSVRALLRSIGKWCWKMLRKMLRAIGRKLIKPSGIITLLVLTQGLQVYAATTWYRHVYMDPVNVAARGLAQAYQHAADAKAHIESDEAALQQSATKDYGTSQAEKTNAEQALLKAVHEKAGVKDTRPIQIPKAEAFPAPKN